MKYSITKRNKIIYQLSTDSKTEKFTFDNINLLLNKHVLIPHPDTLQLIQIATRILKKNQQIETIADVGTGSGLIAISLAKRFPSKKFLASDICPEALNIAKKNSLLNQIQNINFLPNIDQIWLSEYKQKKIDFIISNPPFVGEEEFKTKKFWRDYPEVELEPKNAIVANGDKLGLNPYLEIVKNSNNNKTRSYLFQCNSETIDSLIRKIKKMINCKINISEDDLGKKRFLFLEK